MNDKLQSDAALVSGPYEDGDAAVSVPDGFESVLGQCDMILGTWLDGLNNAANARRCPELVLIGAVVLRAASDLLIIPISGREQLRCFEAWSQSSAWAWVMSDDEDEFSFIWCMNEIAEAIGEDATRGIETIRRGAVKRWGIVGEFETKKLTKHRADRIISIVEELFGVSCFGRLRTNRRFIARASAMFAMRFWLRASHQSIANLFNKDRSTVMHAIKKIISLREMGDERLDVLIERLTAEFGTPKVMPIFSIRTVVKRNEKQDWDF